MARQLRHITTLPVLGSKGTRVCSPHLLHLAFHISVRVGWSAPRQLMDEARPLPPDEAHARFRVLAAFLAARERTERGILRATLLDMRDAFSRSPERHRFATFAPFLPARTRLGFTVSAIDRASEGASE